MINFKKRTSLLLLALCFFLVFTSLSMYYAGYVKDNLSCVSARYDKAAVSSKALEKSLSNLSSKANTPVPKIALWNRLKKESVQNSTTKLTAQINVIETSKDMSLIIPMQFICGNYVYENDNKGCVLDAKTAYKLFGTTKAINNSVTWKNKEYIVRGVAKANDAMMLVSISDKNYLYCNVEALYQTNVMKNIADNEALQLKNLLTQSGIAEPDAIIDGTEISWKLHFISKLPLLVLCLMTAVLFIRCSLKVRHSLISSIFYGLASMLLLLFLITNFKLYIPSQFIPTKWSDFQFYVTKIKEIKEYNININNCQLMPKDLMRKSYELKSMICSGISLVSLVFVNVCLMWRGDKRA